VHHVREVVQSEAELQKRAKRGHLRGGRGLGYYEEYSVNPNPNHVREVVQREAELQKRAERRHLLAFTRYRQYQQCMVYDI